MVIYFSYGANTNLSNMLIRCPTANKLGIAYIDNCKLLFRYHADIDLNVIGSRCYGMLWALTVEDLDALDYVECYPEYYTREQLSVIPIEPLTDSSYITTNNTVYTWVYKMANKIPIARPPLSYYKTCFAGYMQNGIDTTQLEEARYL